MTEESDSPKAPDERETPDGGRDVGLGARIPVSARTVHTSDGGVTAMVRSVFAAMSPQVRVNGSWLDSDRHERVLAALSSEHTKASVGLLFDVKVSGSPSDAQMAKWLGEHLAETVADGSITEHGRPLPPGVHPGRVMAAIAAGEEVFWARVADAFPECSTGDFDAGDSIELAMALDEAVARWLVINWPEQDADASAGGDA